MTSDMLYEGANLGRVQIAFRNAIKSRGVNTVILGSCSAVLIWGFQLEVLRPLFFIFAGWFLFNEILRRSSALIKKFQLTYSFYLTGHIIDAILTGLCCWSLGGAEWAGFISFFALMVFSIGLLTVREALPVYVSTLAGYGLYLGIVGAGVLPAQGIMQPAFETGNLQAVIGPYVLMFMAFGFLEVAIARYSASLQKRGESLERANTRLKALNEDISEKHFSLLCIQQDLILANEKLKQKNEEVLRSHEVIQTLATAVEAKDNYTEGHSVRVAAYAILLAREIGLSREEQGIIKHGCLLHDLGKINISDLILRKPTKLTEKEYDQIKAHPEIGERICKPLSFAAPFLDVIRHHHERIDGKGYPDCLRDREISLHARIAAIADSYDAMTSDRPYRKALSPGMAFARLREYAGLQWDYDLTNDFIKMMEKRYHAEPELSANLNQVLASIAEK